MSSLCFPNMSKTSHCLQFNAFIHSICLLSAKIKTVPNTLHSIVHTERYWILLSSMVKSEEREDRRRVQLFSWWKLSSEDAPPQLSQFP